MFLVRSHRKVTRLSTAFHKYGDEFRAVGMKTALQSEGGPNREVTMLLLDGRHRLIAERKELEPQMHTHKIGGLAILGLDAE